MHAGNVIGWRPQTDCNAKQSSEMAHSAYVMESGRITLQGDSRELIDYDYVRKACLGL
jgi:ABC-type branched-subunit amino acid transport system ATPase component